MTSATALFFFVAAFSFCASANELQCQLDDASHVQMIRLSEEARKQIVEVHNTFRRAVANGGKTTWHRNAEGKLESFEKNGASNMNKISYSCELEELALDNLRELVSKQVNFSLPEFDYMGESYDQRNGELTAGSLPFAFKEVITNWMHPFEAGSYRNRYSVHYKKASQVVAAIVESIGCAAKVDDVNFRLGHVLCLYEPGGNLLSMNTYEVGEACSRCPAEESACEEGLCVAPKKA